MDVHLRDLRYFAAVAQELHFTRAAESLFISQPALSKQIRMLERQLRTPLFIRNRRSVELTAAGAALLPVARDLLQLWDAGTVAIRQAVAAGENEVSIGMSTSPGRGGILPAVRSRFRSTHPHAELIVRQFGWDDPTAGLADDLSDLAYVWLPLPSPARYRWITVADEPCVVALPADHPLAALPAVRVADVEREPMLALPPSAGALRELWLLAGHRSRPAQIGAQVNGAEETYEALVDGRGIVVLANGNAPLLKRDGIVMRPLLDGPRGVLALAWHSDDHRSVVTDYVAACRDVVAGRSPASA